MGHIRLGRLPRTRRWDQVVELIKSDGDTPAIASATLEAAHLGLEDAAGDDALSHATWLLTQLPLAARESDYPARLRALGLATEGPPTVLDLVGAFSDAVDAHVRQSGRRTDLGEMAQMAAAETLAATLGEKTHSLFGTAPDDVRRELGTLATSRQFGTFARDFFSRLVNRYMSFFLSRELSNHVAAGRRFANMDGHTEFNAALDLHCRQAARIVEEFAGGWFSKTNFEGGITPEKVRGFVYVALTKLRAELRKRGEER